MTQAISTQKTAGLIFAAPRSLYFAIFAVSGFSGLIYESIWSHYLKLFLGHAAYAQSLVLIIFMGGMAIGSWLASRYSSRSKLPILIYAIVEVIVGLAALLFHGVFTSVIETFYTGVLPGVGSPFLGGTLKWLAASLLIMPQSMLLGMTFPLMSAGIIRRFPDMPGGSIAMLYFTNSIGAAMGVLASGFLMIKALGLPGTMFTAGLLNVVLALVVWILIKLDPAPETPPLKATPGTPARDTLAVLFLIAAFITGAASFIYEIAWIRMLSLVLGATTHSFELMLSAFITGLAFGGLWIKRRIDRIGEPVRFSGYVQIIMGVFALLTIPVYMLSYEWMAALMSALAQTGAGYAGFNLASHGIALAVMLPTTFMAGMTLPLFTFVLIQKGSGESSIGRIYAANTVGAIVGVLFAVHIGLPFIGLKNLIVFGALLDIVLGLVLLMRSAPEGAGSGRLVGATLTGLGAIGLAIIFADIDRKLLISGVYRTGDYASAVADELLYYRDGKTASVSLRRHDDGSLVLATNGKVDASIQVVPGEPASLDEVTMIMAGSLPLAYKPDARRVANIGMGSGQTTHVLLADPGLEVVDTIEIEAAMAQASRFYGEQVARAYDDPRSNIHIEDAKTFFSLHNSVYDLIVAEPSNPWVSGVASLFSTEFYRTIKRHLTPDGLFVQWIQLYEFTDELAVSILKALSENFGDYVIYTTDGTNILIVAANEGDLREPDWDKLWQGALGESLARVGIRNAADMMIRQVAARDSITPFLTLKRTPVNSDYYPYVDLNAAEARFRNARANMFWTVGLAPLPVLEMLHGQRIDYAALSRDEILPRLEFAYIADWAYRKLTGGSVVDPEGLEGGSLNRIRYLADWLLLAGQDCAADRNPERWRAAAHQMAIVALPYLEPARGEALVERLFAIDCNIVRDRGVVLWRELYEGIARRDGAAMARAGSALLNLQAARDRDEQDYLINATMLGLVASGRADEAFGIWAGYGEPFYGGQPLESHVKLVSSIAVLAGVQADMQAASQ